MDGMKKILVEKVVVNMGVGQAGEELDKAVLVLEKITGGAKPVRTLCRVKQPGWGIRKGMNIGAKVTLRKKKALGFLKDAFKAKDNQLKEKNFDKTGNFGFGVKEYLDLPSIKYDPQFGIRGFDVLVSLEKPGYRIKKRKIKKHRVPLRHVVKRPDAIEFVKKEFGVEIQ